VRLFVLALGRGSGLDVLRTVASDTGGLVLDQADPTGWPDTARELMRGAMSEAIGTEPMNVRFIGDASRVPGGTIGRWNRTWLKDGASSLAEGVNVSGAATMGSGDGGSRVMAARWRVGLGEVCAVALAADTAQAEALADLVAASPVDPRLSITYETGAELRVRMDAQSADGLSAEVGLVDTEANDAGIRSFPMRQVGPGRYEVVTSSPREPVTAVVIVGGRVAGRISIAGRYAAEFEAVGNDLETMREISSETGGRVVMPDETDRIDMKLPARDVDLTAWLAFFGFLAVLWGLAVWKRDGASAP
jgi:hypothetical protein